MLQLRCTRKVLDQFKIQTDTLFEPEPTDAALGNWYVNLATIERRKTLIFMSERTLLSFLVFGIRNDNAKNLEALFVHGLVQLLEFEGFTGEQVSSALGSDGVVVLTKTDNRKALGSMNDLVQVYEQKIWYEHGFKYCDLWKTISSTNRMPQKNLGWGFSIDLARELVSKKTKNSR